MWHGLSCSVQERNCPVWIQKTNGIRCPVPFLGLFSPWSMAVWNFPTWASRSCWISKPIGLLENPYLNLHTAVGQLQRGHCTGLFCWSFQHSIQQPLTTRQEVAAFLASVTIIFASAYLEGGHQTDLAEWGVSVCHTAGAVRWHTINLD